MKLIYNAGIYLFIFIARILSPFSIKARQWTLGTRSWRTIQERLSELSGKRIWIHCASLGEFEQGRPLIEAIRKKDPSSVIILSFFSPSGYEIRKNYSQADVVCYLPPDTQENAREFIAAVNPGIVIFIKYEFWNNYISVLKERGIPLYLVSGIFRKGQHFFRWYGGFFRKMLSGFSWFFVQDNESAELLKTAGFDNVTVAGDTRFDRVVEISKNARDIRELETFCGGERTFLAGSSWPGDEAIFAGYINNYPERLKWIFAPHEISEQSLSGLEKLLKVKTVRFSAFSEAHADARVLIIDNIGMLSSAYRYATIAGVGGGFGKGIHNILEPACWGIPVVFGPNHMKFREAKGMIDAGASWSFSNYSGFRAIMDSLTGDRELYALAAKAAGEYVARNAGATGIVMSKIF